MIYWFTPGDAFKLLAFVNQISGKTIVSLYAAQFTPIVSLCNSLSCYLADSSSIFSSVFLLCLGASYAVMQLPH